MTEDIYKQKKEIIMLRFYSAMKAKCKRTAKARARDYAKLEAEYNGLDYEQIYNYLLQEQGL